MKLDIDEIEFGRSELPISGSLSLDMGPDHPNFASVEGSLTVENLDTRFLVNGTLKADVETHCARCMKAFNFTWKVPVEILVLRNQDKDEGEGDTVVLFHSRGEVDLREALTECLVLTYPISTVCGEDCKGICPTCGIDWNLQSCDCKDEDYDPRWAGLDNL